MCASSAVSDYYMREWPVRFPQNPHPFEMADYETKRLMREVLERLDKIDKRLGDIECKDEAKAAFYQTVGAQLPDQSKGK